MAKAKTKKTKKKTTKKEHRLLPGLSIALSILSLALVVFVFISMKGLEERTSYELEILLNAMRADFDTQLNELAAFQPVAPETDTNTDGNGPLAFDLDSTVARSTVLDFTVTERFNSDYFVNAATECGRPLVEGYADDLQKGLVGQTGYEYIFTSVSESQAPEAYSVTVIPNVHGYLDLGEFEDDYELCSAGGEAYPVDLTPQWLMFESSCGTGFSDGSGLPIGCEIVRDSLANSMKLK